MNIQEMRSRLGEIRDELEGMDPESLTEEQEARFDALSSEVDTLTANIEKAEARAAVIERARVAASKKHEDRGIEVPNVNTRQSDPFDLEGIPAYGAARTREVRGRTIDAIERSTRFTSDAHRAEAVRKVERYGNAPGLAELILLRSSDAYADAFLRKLTEPDMLSREDLAALQQVKELQRAMALSDVTGVLVPSHLDTTVVLSNDGTVNPFRQVCRVETGTTNVWTGITSAGVTASWDAEAAEVSDDAPSFSNPPVTAFKASAFVPISYEAFEDARGREDDIVMMIRDAKDRLESTAFATGNGTSAPRGLVTALDANTNVEVANTTSNTFGLADVYNVYENLPARWRNDRTAWFANLAIINDIRQFGTDNYNTQTVQLGARTVPAVLGHAILESSAMDGTIGAAGTDNILVVGDPSQYVVYDRIGLSVEFVPNLFGTTNGRPTGQRGWMAHFRTGANTQVDTAFRLLQAETNA